MKCVSKPSPVPPSAFDQVPPLSPFIICRLAGRKGIFVDTIMKGKGGRRFVRLADITGEPIATPRMFGFTLYEAKRYLEQLPDPLAAIYLRRRLTRPVEQLLWRLD